MIKIHPVRIWSFIVGILYSCFILIYSQDQLLQLAWIIVAGCVLFSFNFMKIDRYMMVFLGVSSLLIPLTVFVFSALFNNNDTSLVDMKGWYVLWGLLFYPWVVISPVFIIANFLISWKPNFFNKSF